MTTKSEEITKEQIKFCYSCGTGFPWESGPHPYCGKCGTKQPYLSRSVQPITAELAEIGVGVLQVR